MNLIPLCPNCHLRDQHNPTSTIPIEKLKLFRKYKDPAILLPQFDPIFKRMLFLLYSNNEFSNYKDLVAQSNELIKFISYFEMGRFYSNRLQELLGENSIISGYPSMPEFIDHYRQRLITNTEQAVDLLIELLRYQKWENFSDRKKEFQNN